MRFHLSSTSRILGIIGIAGLIVAAVPGIAEASPHGGGNFTCNGTLAAPGTLAGNFANVTIAGTCLVDAGDVHVSGNLTVAPNAALVADFGQNDQTQSGTSNITVGGNVTVLQGASLMLGCYPLIVTVWGVGSPIQVPDFPCFDDPNAFTTPTLSATESIGGNLVADGALGVVVHNTVVRGNVYETGGGNGTAFNPVGIFAVYIPGIALPAYFDYANVTVGGNMVVTGMNENWYGIIRNTVHGNLVNTNNNVAADGNETVDNTVNGNLVCSGNSPAVQFGDSDGGPNRVGGNATGECAFGLLLPNPPPEAGAGVPPVFQPISVPLH